MFVTITESGADNLKKYGSKILRKICLPFYDSDCYMAHQV